jgi:hypothetical protein
MGRSPWGLSLGGYYDHQTRGGNRSLVEGGRE